MFKYLKLILIAFICIAVTACGDSTKGSQLSIDFSSDSSSVVISGMSEKSLAYLKNNVNIDTNYRDIVSIVQVPNEDDTLGREIILEGKCKMENDHLIFIPKIPFVKGRNYLVQTIVGSEFGSGTDIFTSDVGSHVKAQERLLKR